MALTDCDTDPNLTKSYKKAYPFRLGTTSFIYPDDYLPNIRRIGPYLDEIELLMFESRSPENLPSTSLIEEMKEAAEMHDLRYNIHLPTDVSLTDPACQHRAVEVLGRFIRRTLPLLPTAYALHLPYDLPSESPEAVEGWRKMAANGIRKLLDCGVESRRLAIETLDYPFAWIEDILEAYDLSVCFDIGHLFLNDLDPTPFFSAFESRIPLIHLHGVREGRDHLALDALPEARAKAVAKILDHFKGTVSLEVFSFPRLAASLAFLEELMASGKGRS